MTKEDWIHQKIVAWLKDNYPDALFRTDLAGIRLTTGQATKIKRLQDGRRGWPDIFLPEPMGDYCGFYGEIKIDRNEVFKKNGSIRQSKHIQEQWAMLQELRNRGYAAEWLLGLSDAKLKLEAYLDKGKVSYE